MARASKTETVTIQVPDNLILAAFHSGNAKMAEGLSEFIQSSLGGKPASTTRRSSGGQRVKRGLHHVMAIKALAAAGAVNKKGAVERAAVMEAGKSLDHDFGSTLSATLDTLAEKKLVEYENISENKKPRYKWWLIKSEKECLDALGASDEAS